MWCSQTKEPRRKKSSAPRSIMTLSGFGIRVVTLPRSGDAVAVMAPIGPGDLDIPRECEPARWPLLWNLSPVCLTLPEVDDGVFSIGRRLAIR